VAKIDPFLKKWINNITLPTTTVSSCAFGGEDLRTLFMTTAFEPLNDSERNQQPTAGCLFSAELEVGGYQTNTFKASPLINNNSWLLKTIMIPICFITFW